MTNVIPSAETVVIISGFAFVYMLVLLRKTLQGKFDLYDFLMLSMVAILPASFALLPGLTIFRGLYELVAASGDAPGSLTIQSGLTTLLGAGAILVAIATGTVFGEILASPWDRTLRGARPEAATATRGRATTRAGT